MRDMTIEKHTSAHIMLYLSGCVLSGTKPDNGRVADVDLEKLYKLSKFHSLTALTFEGLRQSGYMPTAENQSIYDAFRESGDKAVRKNLMLDTERERLFSYMEQKGIWYMMLKGTVLKDMYPKSGLRQMADNDILFDENHREAVRDWFVGQGYKVKGYGISNHDAYLKEPIYNYEMHVALYGETHESRWVDYYKSVRERLLTDGKSKFGYRFTDEDFYVYFVLHGFKHFDANGTGLRFLLDMYVYLKAKQTEMNFDYIEAELQKLGIFDFEQSCRRLVSKVFAHISNFDPQNLTSAERELLTCFLTSGTYGTVEQRVQNAVNKKGKLRFLLCRFFPGTKILSVYNPVFENRLLLPIGWVYRAVKILTSRPGKVKREFFAIAKSEGKTK